MLQDAVLLGYMKKKQKVAEKKVRMKDRNNLWSYQIKVKDTEKAVCRRFLLSLLKISEMRLRIIQTALRTGAVLQHRGKHSNRPSKIETGVWQMVEETGLKYRIRNHIIAEEKQPGNILKTLR